MSRLSDQAIGDTYLALAYYYSGSVDQAITLLTALVKSSSASTASRAGVALASVLGARKQSAEARAHLDQVLDRPYRDHHVAYSIGTAYVQLGDFAEGMRWLRTAADTGFSCLPWYERDPLLEPLRATPQFPELLDYVRTKREAALKPSR